MSLVIKGLQMDIYDNAIEWLRHSASKTQLEAVKLECKQGLKRLRDEEVATDKLFEDRRTEEVKLEWFADTERLLREEWGRPTGPLVDEDGDAIGDISDINRCLATVYDKLPFDDKFVKFVDDSPECTGVDYECWYEENSDRVDEYKCSYRMRFFPELHFCDVCILDCSADYQSGTHDFSNDFIEYLSEKKI
jgi:hypothetical protein